MLRSMLIGLAVAAVLQVGAQEYAPVSASSLASHHVDWVRLQAVTLARLVCDGCSFLVH